MCVVQANFSSATLNRQSHLKKVSIIITTGGHAQNSAEDRREQQLTSVLLLKNFLFETRRRLGSTDNGVGLMAERVKHSQPRGFFFSGGG
jgi:hypothetical protein